MEITESNKCNIIKESTENSQIFDIFQFSRLNDKNETAIAIETQYASFAIVCLPFPSFSHSHNNFFFNSPRKEYYFVYIHLFCVLFVVYISDEAHSHHCFFEK